ncbi:MAG: chromosome segregation protein SMC [Desulfobacterales bacterium]|jgi:chromosome segregation protein
MKLKKLEIQGFKSFQDKAAISFPEGISAVVGPNGCGKSNVIDAIRWVMGEQSVKKLRGKAMEDVIFAGANGKAPLNMAEVAMILKNDNGSAPEELRDYAEIMITRRLYRSGESAYFLNKQPCRLKDIHNLFLGSGLGTKSFAVIQQGNIGAITDAGPEERRHFIEEAAGVTRFKYRRQETLSKIQSTNQNLYRIMDIIGEIKRQMASLKRQARKAELFKTYQERIRTLDIFLGLHYFDAYAREIAESEGVLKTLQDADLSHVAEIKKLDAAVEEIKIQRWQKNQEIAEQKSRQFEQQRQIDKTENDIAHLREESQRLGTEVESLDGTRAEIARKNERMRTEIVESETEHDALQQASAGIRAELERERSVSREIAATLEARQAALNTHKARLTDLVGQEARYRNIHQTAQNTRENLQRRIRKTEEEVILASRAMTTAEKNERQATRALETLQEEIQVQKRQIEALRTRLEVKSRELADQIRKVQGLELERSKQHSRYASLKKMEANFEWYRDGVKALMKGLTPEKRRAQGIRGLVADIIAPQPGYEAAVEAALGESLQYVLVDRQEQAMNAIDFLRQGRAGRSGFVPLPDTRPLTVPQAPPPPENERLLNHVVVNEGYDDVAEALLGHVTVADDLETAVARFNRNGVFRSIVTLKGETVSCQGTIAGGRGGESAGILAHKQEIRQLHKSIAGLDGQIQSQQQVQTALQAAVQSLENELRQELETKNHLVEDEIESQKALYKAMEDLKAARRHLEIVQLEQERLLGEESDIDSEISRYDEILSEVAEEVGQAQQQVTALTGEIDTITHEMESFHQREMDIQVRLTAHQAKLENTFASLRRLKEFQADGEARFESLVEEIRAKRERREDAQQRIHQSEENLSGLYADLQRLSDVLDTNEASYQAIDARLGESDAAIAQVQTQREKNNEKLRLLELELSQRRIKCENIVNRLDERYHNGIDTLRHEIEAQHPDGFDLGPEETEAELDRCRKKIANIHDVNLGAIKEYEQLKTRFDFLCEQRDDLNQAIDDLHQVIRRINTVTQKRFLATFEQVNEKLAEVFPRLFEGGTAKLVLAEPERPLESGVELMIQPPGKKVTRISLLSGGEKALSAIAFIFAIFLIKPAAFCLLDEIDAPLDDANVLRFNELLKIIGEKSQIIMITHNKKTMEFADTLFGITMEKKGISKVVSVNLERNAA